MTTATVTADWRSGAYGANRTAHLFVWPMFGTKKAPACGARVRVESYGRVQSPVRECPECASFRDLWL